jgi:hypothetical protein
MPALEPAFIVDKLGKNLPSISTASDFPGAFRASNMRDRLMQRMDRRLFSAQYYHCAPGTGSGPATGEV